MHMDHTVVEDIIRKLKEKLGQESPLVTTQGKTLEYLGMCIDHTPKGKVKKSMYEYINKMLAAIRHEWGVQYTSSASPIQCG